MNVHAHYREPVCRLLAARGGEGLPMAEIASALGCEVDAVSATLKYLYAHGRLSRRMEHYRLKVGASVSSRQRRYRWFMPPEACPGSLLGDGEGMQDAERVLKRGHAAGRQVDRLPAPIVAE